MSSRSQLRLAELAHQILSFRLSSGSPLANEFDQDTLHRVDYLVHELNVEKPLSSNTHSYPPDWLIHRSILHKDVKEFLRLSDDLITSLPQYQQWVEEHPANALPEPKRPLGRVSRSRSRASSVSTTNEPSSGTAVQTPVGTRLPQANDPDPVTTTSRAGDQPGDRTGDQELLSGNTVEHTSPLRPPPTVRPARTRSQLERYLNPRRLSFGQTTVEPTQQPQRQQHLELPSSLLSNPTPFPYQSMAAEQSNPFTFTTGRPSGASTMSSTVPVASGSRSTNEPSMRELLDAINNTQRRFGAFEDRLTALTANVQTLSARNDRDDRRDDGERFQSGQRPPDDPLHLPPDFPRPPPEPPRNPLDDQPNPPYNPLNDHNGNGRTEAGYWKTDEVGYFWPDMREDVAMTQIGNQVYYKDTNTFLDRMRDIAAYKGEALVKANLPACFRGAALSWYSFELTDRERRLIRASATLEDGMFLELAKRFKPNPVVALNKLNNMTYTFADVRAQRPVQSFAQEVVRLARAADIDNPFNQIMMIWNHLDPYLQQHIPQPTKNDRLGPFLDQLEQKSYMWQNLANANAARRAQRNAALHDPVRNGNADANPRQVPYQAPNPRNIRGGFQNNQRYSPNANWQYNRPWQNPNQNQGQWQNRYQAQNRWQPRPQNQNQLPYQYRPPTPPRNANVNYNVNDNGPSNTDRGNAWRNNQRNGNTGYQGQNNRQPWNKNSYRGNIRRSVGAYSAITNEALPRENQDQPHVSFDFGQTVDQDQSNRFTPQESFDPSNDSNAYYTDQPYDNHNDYDYTAYAACPPDDQFDELDEAYYADQSDQFADSPYAFSALIESTPPIDNTVSNISDQVKDPPTVVVTCLNCHEGFASNNKLHQHLPCATIVDRNEPTVSLESAMVVEPEVSSTDEPFIIESDRSDDTLLPIGLRSWRAVTADLGLNTTTSYSQVCLDTGCSSTVVNATFAKTIPELDVHTIDHSVNVSGIGSLHSPTEYAVFYVYFPSLIDDQNRHGFTKIRVRAYIVEGIKPNLLIGINVMGREGIVVDPDSGRGVIHSYKDFTFAIDCKPKIGHTPPIPVYATRRTVIPAMSCRTISVKVKPKLPDRDLIFEPIDGTTTPRLTYYAHLVDVNFSYIEVSNNTSEPIVVPRHTRLGAISDSDYVTAYQVDESAAELARPFVKPIIDNPDQPPVLDKSTKRRTNRSTEKSLIDNRDIDKDKTTVTPLGITVYGENPETIRQIREITEQFDIWANDDGSNVGVADIPEDQWLQVPMKSGWEQRIPKPRVYRLSLKDREVIDKTFDPLYDQGKLTYATNRTPAGYPVFVVYKDVWTPDGFVSKGRVVIDLRGANKESIPDVYPVLPIDDIIALVKDCFFITVLDACQMFYQWPTRRDHRDRLAIISHRGQEIFNVAIMGFINSIPFVQRQMELRLKDLFRFCRVYVDDILIASRTFKEHCYHLKLVFKELLKLRLKLAPKKAFIGFPSIRLLGQRVDALGLYTPQDKLKAIQSLKFPLTLKDLEHYIGLTSWFRNYIDRFAAKIEPLQARKTALLKGAPKDSPTNRNRYVTTTLYNDPTDQERQAFDALQEEFCNEKFLTHYDRYRQLYVDLDASRKGHGVMVYHLADTYTHPDIKIPPVRTAVQPVLFLSRTLTTAESRYWPTELEVSCLVWMLRKIRHLVEDAVNPVVIYTDHQSTVNIARQPSLNTVATDKLNLRLVRASHYVQQFRVIIIHRPGKTNVVADALSRLPAVGNAPTDYDVDLDSTFTSQAFQLGIAAYAGSTVLLASDFKDRLRENYAKDPRAQRIIDVLRSDTEATLPYQLDDEGILFMKRQHVSSTEYIHEDLWIYLPRPMVSELFKSVHDNRNHQGLDKCLNALDGIAIHQGRRLLRDYIARCPTCLLNKPRRHLPYGQLQPIVVPPEPFHTITLDFIVALPTEQDFDQILVFVDKFTKRVGLLPGKSTWKSIEWGKQLLTYFQGHDWGLPRTFISDRDPRFTSGVWKGLFSKLGIAWYYSTSYHPQTDGMSERTIQTIEIMIRHAVTQGLSWLPQLPVIVSTLNTSPNASTKETPVRLLFGIDFRQPWNLLKGLVYRDHVGPRLDAEEALKYASMRMKWYYDQQHRPISFEPGDKVFVKLHKGYALPTTKTVGPKFSQQYAGPYTVLQKIGRHAYRIDLPPAWNVHNVLSVAQLELYARDTDHTVPDQVNDLSTDQIDHQTDEPNNQSVDQLDDQVDRDRFAVPGPVHDDQFEIDRIIDKRITRKGRGPYFTQYLVRYTGHGPDHDEWVKDTDMNAPELIEEYERQQD